MLVQPSTGLVIAGKYRLLERIGVGGMSEVYRAENLAIGRIVALKLLLPDQAHDKTLAARFFQEAQSVGRIHHPGIVDVFDAGDGETGPYIVMEHLEGESAAHVLARRGALGLSAALATVLPVLDALSAAHEMGIVHRDIKPENVFYSLDENGDVTVKLLDFGIAKLLWPSGPTPRTSTGVVFGTPDYLSPEQANGEPVIDGRSDLFSVGVVLFELLTNTRPFHAPTTVATAYKITHARAPHLRDHGGPAESTLDAIVMRALAKRPSERYPTAAAFTRELALLAPPAAEMRRALRELVQAQRSSGVQRSARPAARESEPPPSSHPPAPRPSGSTRISAGALPSFTPPALPSESSSSSGVRSLPSRFAGHCHVRGIVLSAVDRYIAERFPARRAQMLERLGAAHAREFLDGTLQAIVYYDLEGVSRYLDLVTHELCRGNPTWARIAGELAVGGELAGVLRTALRRDQPLTVVRRVVPVCSRFFDFGLWEVDGSGDVPSVRVTDFEAANQPLRHWLAGVLDGSLRAVDVRAHVTIARGDASFSPQLLLDVSAR